VPSSTGGTLEVWRQRDQPLVAAPRARGDPCGEGTLLTVGRSNVLAELQGW